MPQEDLESAGFLGVTLALKTYDEAKGKFITHARWYVLREMRRERNREQKYRQHVARDTDDKTSKKTIEKKEDLTDLLYSAIEELPEEERQVITRRFGIGRKKEKYDDTARSLGLWGNNLTRLTQSGLTHLRERLGDML